MYRILSPTVAAIIAATTLGVAAQSPPLPTSVGSTVMPRALAVARSTALTTIQGNTLTSTNGVLPDAVVRLRDARAGRIRGTQTTDRAGLFAFHSVEPGTYVVEIVGDDQTILAASQMLNVDAGDTVSAVVKLPFRIPLMGGLLGHTVQSATAIAVAAAASGFWRPKSRLRSLLSRSKPDEGTSGQHAASCDSCRSRKRGRSGRLAGAAFLGRQRRPHSGSPRGRLPVSSHRRRRVRADGGRHDDPGLFRRPDVSGAGAASHRERAIDGAARVDERADAFYEDPEPYYKTQYKILRGPRSHAPRRQAAEARDDAGIQRHGEPPPSRRRRSTDIGERMQRGPRRRRTPAAEAPKVDETPDESALVSAFIGRVAVKPVRGSRLVDVLFDSTDPKFAAEAVNALARGVRRTQNLAGQAAEHAEHAGRGWTRSCRASSRKSRTASARSPNTATSRTPCRSTTSRTSCCPG